MCTHAAKDHIPAAPDSVRVAMKGVVHDRYGSPDVLRLEDVARPVPAADEVLVKVHATTVNRTDCGFRMARPFFIRIFTGIFRPKHKILGMEFAGEVEAVGARVTEFAVGDEVFGVKATGANAEYVCVRESAPLAHKPSSMTFDEAAAVCDGACSARSCLRQADVRGGQQIVVYGASGSIGTAGVQLAKDVGAHVTAVCNAKNVELVRSLGADAVVDYEHEDFRKRSEAYDLVFDAVGKYSFRRCRRVLKPAGTYLTMDGGFMWHVPFLALLTKWIGKKRVRLGVARYTKDDVLYLKELIDAGNYRAVIDRRYPLEQVVEATRYVETGQKTGNVVLTVSSDPR
jgi:NADPH:quinone reductase-like Zn-dependent oxidoreductase